MQRSCMNLNFQASGMSGPLQDLPSFGMFLVKLHKASAHWESRRVDGMIDGELFENENENRQWKRAQLYL